MLLSFFFCKIVSESFTLKSRVIVIKPLSNALSWKLFRQIPFLGFNLSCVFFDQGIIWLATNKEVIEIPVILHFSLYEAKILWRKSFWLTLVFTILSFSRPSANSNIGSILSISSMGLFWIVESMVELSSANFSHCPKYSFHIFLSYELAALLPLFPIFCFSASRLVKFINL